MRLYFSIVLFLFGLAGFAQNKPVTEVPSPFTKVDSLYREDQFYLGITYNLLNETRELKHMVPEFSQNGFSLGLSAGFLRDMPINKSRTVAIAAGLGFSYDKYHENIVVTETGGMKHYEILHKDSFSNNKLEQLFVDLPIELRWRNSTPVDYKFWRIYGGFKVRYQIWDKSKYVDGTKEVILNNSDLNSLHYGPYISVGHNTINLHVYYGMNPIFKKTATIDGKPIDMKTLNFGLMFYIL